MRQLLPEPTGHVDPRAVYALAKRDEAHVRVNMVTTLDGAAAFRGRVGPVSGPPDDALLHLLRGFADVVLVGAGTIRAEGYGPDLLPAAEQRRRVAAGPPQVPALAVVSGKLDLDLTAPVFEASVIRPLVLTTSDAPAERRAAAGKVADVVVVGKGAVDLAAAVQAIAARGLPRVLCEGGPHLLAQLFAADLVDELCLAISPLVACGAELRVTSGDLLPAPASFHLKSVLEDDGFLFLRYARGVLDGRAAT